MRIKSLAAAAAATSLMMAPVPAMASASSLSVTSAARASADAEGESNMFDSGFIGFALVFGAGALVGILLYNVITGDEDPESP